MPKSSIVREKQKPLRNEYQETPARATKTYRLVANGADGADPFHSTATSLSGAGAGATFAIAVDPKVGGPGGAPTPGDLFLAALATCQESSLRMVADSLGVELTSVEVEVTGEVDVRGALLLAADVPVGFRSIACRVRFAVPPGTPSELVGKLTGLAERCCVIASTLKQTPPFATSFEPIP